MKLSINWLKDFIDLDVTKEELANKITFTGIEVEDISSLCEATNLVIGYVMEKEKHPNADTLNITKVNVGDEVLQIVCGAPNVDKGQKVMVAKVGAVLPGNFKIKASKIREVESNGMICALTEIGIDKKFVDDSELDGIHVLSEDAPIGENPLEYLQLNDEVLELDVLADRPDALSMYGLAYEVGAIYSKEVRSMETNYTAHNFEDEITIDVATEDCLMFNARQMKGISIKESPAFIKARLIANDIRPINNVVDITNYVLLEYGQPLHAFDADKLGLNILVRNAQENELLKTLDDQERKLEQSDIVITDGTKAQALGGVMGGFDTEVDDNTTSIVLEAAVFDSQTIRKTSKRLGLRSDSSSRFEKGIDHNRTLEALNRASYLLEKYADAKVSTYTASVNKIQNKDEFIEVKTTKVRSLLGVEITDQEICDILSRYGFEYENNKGLISFKKLTRRSDLQISEDVIEEIGRLYGYDKIEGELPSLQVKTGSISPEYQLNKDIKNVLTMLGLSETVNYSLTHESRLTEFTNDVVAPIKLMHPLSEDKSTLRYSLIPSLVDVIKYNQARTNNDLRIFEISSSYYQKEEQYIEVKNVAIALSGMFTQTSWLGVEKPVDFYVAKGIVEQTFDYVGLSGRYSFKEATDAPKEFHPTRVASIVLQNKHIGYIGQVHPSISSEPIYVAEFSFDKIAESKVRLIKFQDIPKFPSMVRDLAIKAEKTIKVADIINEIGRNGGRILKSVDIFDVYDGEKMEEGFQSIAFKLTYQDPKNTLTDDEVKASIEKILKGLEKKLKIGIRQ